MNFSITAKPLVFLILWTPLLLAQIKPGSPDATQVLESRATIDSLKYCQGDSHTFTVYIKLRLALANKSDSPIIVSRRVKIPAIRVSKMVEDATKGKFVYDPSEYEISVAPLKSVKFGSKPDPAIFVVLNPGEKYEMSEWTGVLADLSSSPAADSGIVPGRYVVQAVLNTWPYPNNPRIGTIEVWSKFGRLAHGVTKTAFFQADFPVVRSAQSCRSFAAPK